MILALVSRFEAPNPSARWDSPLFTIQVDDQLPDDDIISALFEKQTPKPNLSTQNPPLMSPSFVHEADQVLQVRKIYQLNVLFNFCIMPKNKGVT